MTTPRNSLIVLSMFCPTIDTTCNNHIVLYSPQTHYAVIASYCQTLPNRKHFVTSLSFCFRNHQMTKFTNIIVYFSVMFITTSLVPHVLAYCLFTFTNLTGKPFPFYFCVLILSTVFLFHM